MTQQLPQTGLLRLSHIIGDKKKNTPALIPISRASWFRGVAAGKYPKGAKLGPRTTVWTVEAIRELIASTAEMAR